MAQCPICQCKELSRFFRKIERWLDICTNCRHIFWREMPSDEEIEKHYRRTYSEMHNQKTLQESQKEYYGRHIEELLEAAKLEAKHTTLLDFGCSYPVLLNEARKMGLGHVVGVEWDENIRHLCMAEGIEMRSPVEMIEIIPNGSIDIMRFSHVLEHAVNPRTLLRMAAGKMRPGGLVYITQPSFPVFAPIISQQDLKDTVYPEHLHFFSPISLRMMVEQCDLTIKHFFTHQSADEVVAKFEGQMDLDYSAKRMCEIAELGRTGHGRNSNYPVYSGENSCVFACRNNDQL